MILAAGVGVALTRRAATGTEIACAKEEKTCLEVELVRTAEIYSLVYLPSTSSTAYAVTLGGSRGGTTRPTARDGRSVAVEGGTRLTIHESAASTPAVSGELRRTCCFTGSPSSDRVEIEM